MALLVLHEILWRTPQPLGERIQRIERYVVKLTRLHPVDTSLRYADNLAESGLQQSVAKTSLTQVTRQKHLRRRSGHWFVF